MPAINQNPKFKIEYPKDHDQQRYIAQGFQNVSNASLIVLALDSCCWCSLRILSYNLWILKLSEVRELTLQASDTGLLSNHSIICILAQFVGLGSKVMFLDRRFARRRISFTRSVFFGDRNWFFGREHQGSFSNATKGSPPLFLRPMDMRYY